MNGDAPESSRLDSSALISYLSPVRNTATVHDIALVPAVEWSFRVDVLVSDFEKTSFETGIKLR